MSRCGHVKENGKRCKAKPLNGFRSCWFHEPSLEEERKRARSNGGKNSRFFKDDAPDDIFQAQSLKDLVAVLELAINLVFQGKLHPRRANALGYLCNVSRSCIEAGDIEERLKQLEEVVLGVKH